MFELVGSDHNVVAQFIPTIQEAILEGMYTMEQSSKYEFIWFRKMDATLILGKITKDKVSFSAIHIFPYEYFLG